MAPFPLLQLLPPSFLSTFWPVDLLASCPIYSSCTQILLSWNTPYFFVLISFPYPSVLASQSSGGLSLMTQTILCALVRGCHSTCTSLWQHLSHFLDVTVFICLSSSQGCELFKDTYHVVFPAYPRV